MTKQPKSDQPAHVAGMVRYGNIITEPTSLLTVVRRGLARYERRKDRPGGRLYASQTALCPRQAVLGALATDLEQVSPASAVYYKLGIALEELLVAALRDQGALLFDQYRLPDVGLNLGGYVDAVVYINGRVRVLEIKSCGELPKTPKPEHAAQAMVYAAITGLAPTIFYISRHVATWDGTLKSVEFALNPTDEELRATLFKVAYARAVTDLRRLPAIPAEIRGAKDCGLCRFKHLCWEGETHDLPPISVEDHLTATRRAVDLVEAIMEPGRVRSRRAGVLKHIQEHGSPRAKELLAGDWSHLVDGEN